MFIKEAARRTKFKCCHFSGRGVERMGNPALHSRQGISDGAEGERDTISNLSQKWQTENSHEICFILSQDKYTLNTNTE